MKKNDRRVHGTMIPEGRTMDNGTVRYEIRKGMGGSAKICGDKSSVMINNHTLNMLKEEANARSGRTIIRLYGLSRAQMGRITSELKANNKAHVELKRILDKIGNTPISQASKYQIEIVRDD